MKIGAGFPLRIDARLGGLLDVVPPTELEGSGIHDQNVGVSLAAEGSWSLIPPSTTGTVLWHGLELLSDVELAYRADDGVWNYEASAGLQYRLRDSDRDVPADQQRHRTWVLFGVGYGADRLVAYGNRNRQLIEAELSFGEAMAASLRRRGVEIPIGIGLWTSYQISPTAEIAGRQLVFKGQW